MSKKNKYNDLRECKNYAKQCGIANNCNNCKNRVMGYVQNPYTGLSKLGVKKCRKGLDIADNAHKRDCFECSQEGSAKCCD